MKKVFNEAKEKARGARESLTRRGSEVLRGAAETTSKLLTEASKKAAEFASWVSRVMKDVNVKFEKFEAELKNTKSSSEENGVVDKAVNFAVETTEKAYRMSQRGELSAQELAIIRSIYQKSVEEGGGLAALKENLEDNLKTLKEEEDKHVLGSMGAPPPPPVQHAPERSLPPIPPVQKRVLPNTPAKQAVTEKKVSEVQQARPKTLFNAAELAARKEQGLKTVPAVKVNPNKGVSGDSDILTTRMKEIRSRVASSSDEEDFVHGTNNKKGPRDSWRT